MNSALIRDVFDSGEGIFRMIPVIYTYINNSEFEPMVILKHFGPNNPDMPKTVPVE